MFNESNFIMSYSAEAVVLASHISTFDHLIYNSDLTCPIFEMRGFKADPTVDMPGCQLDS